MKMVTTTTSSNNNDSSKNSDDENVHGQGHHVINNNNDTCNANGARVGLVAADSDKEDCSSDNYYYYYLPSRKARQDLRNHKYSGADNSLLYKYVLSPFASYCVDTFTPQTTSPNLITLIGLIIMVSSYCIYWYYVPTLFINISFDDSDNHPPPPRWIFLYNCIAMLLYQTLDNMDGKQARRTNSSRYVRHLLAFCFAYFSVFKLSFITI